MKKEKKEIIYVRESDGIGDYILPVIFVVILIYFVVSSFLGA